MTMRADSWGLWWRSLARTLSDKRRGRIRVRRLRPTVEEMERRLTPTTPVVLSINRTTPAGPNTSATSVVYTATFDQSVTGVNAADFQVTTSGAVKSTPPVVVGGSGSSWTVTV